MEVKFGELGGNYRIKLVYIITFLSKKQEKRKRKKWKKENQYQKEGGYYCERYEDLKFDLVHWDWGWGWG